LDRECHDAGQGVKRIMSAIGQRWQPERGIPPAVKRCARLLLLSFG
jgi:hypothetical protein